MAFSENVTSQERERGDWDLKEISLAGSFDSKGRQKNALIGLTGSSGVGGVDSGASTDEIRVLA